MNLYPGKKISYLDIYDNWFDATIISHLEDDTWIVVGDGSAASLGKQHCREDQMRPRSPLHELAEAAE